MGRTIFNADKVTPRAQAQINNFHADTVAAVAAAVAQNPVVVVGMAQNPVVKRVRRILGDAGIQYHYLEYGSYFSAWRLRLAIKLWSGWPTFPQVFIRGTLVGGCDDVAADLKAGTLQKLIQG